MKNKKTVIGLACQIVYEYPDWRSEHVEDMLKTYDDNGEKRPCDFDTLVDMCVRANELKCVDGKSYKQTMKILGG